MDSAVGFSLDGGGKRNGVGNDGSELESIVAGGSLNLEAEDAGVDPIEREVVVEHGAASETVEAGIFVLESIAGAGIDYGLYNKGITKLGY